MPWLHSLAITHSCIYVLYKYTYIWIAHPSSLFSIPYRHHQSWGTLILCDTKETSSCPPGWLFHTTLTVQQADKWGQPMLSTRVTHPHPMKREGKLRSRQASRLQWVPLSPPLRPSPCQTSKGFAVYSVHFCSFPPPRKFLRLKPSSHGRRSGCIT